MNRAAIAEIMAIPDVILDPQAMQLELVKLRLLLSSLLGASKAVLFAIHDERADESTLSSALVALETATDRTLKEITE